jgi:hypothetical protein
LRKKMFLAYNTRAYPANRQLLLDLLATRQEIASVLGFRSWADLATADQMMESAANVRTFPGQAGRSQPRRRAATSMSRSSRLRAQRQPELKEIDITSRGYWYEQFRRTKYDFDSQSVRPYFPYAQVEAGVLETAAKLFKVEFRHPLRRRGTRRFRSSRSSMAAACGTVLSRHASARGQGQVVLRRAGSCGRARARLPEARSSAISLPRRKRSGITCSTPTW